MSVLFELMIMHKALQNNYFSLMAAFHMHPEGPQAQ